MRICEFLDCGRKHSARGFCAAHYAQVRQGRELSRINTTPEERFWSKVDKSPHPKGCWEWRGYCGREGYGQMGVGGVGKLAHRVSYEKVHGPIPEGRVIDHRCHNPPCVNPEHLRQATNKQNGENRKGATQRSGTGVLGVYLTKAGTYKVLVGHNYKLHYIGTYKTLSEAASKSISARAKLHTHSHIN